MQSFLNYHIELQSLYQFKNVANCNFTKSQKLDFFILSIYE